MTFTISGSKILRRGLLGWAERRREINRRAMCSAANVISRRDPTNAHRDEIKKQVRLLLVQPPRRRCSPGQRKRRARNKLAPFLGLNRGLKGTPQPRVLDPSDHSHWRHVESIWLAMP